MIRQFGVDDMRTPEVRDVEETRGPVLNFKPRCNRRLSSERKEELVVSELRHSFILTSQEARSMEGLQ